MRRLETANPNLPGIRYFSLTGLAPIHYAAVALNPEMKLEYFEQEWADKPDWVEVAKTETAALWKEEYKDHILAAARVAPTAECSTPGGPDEDVRWRRNKRARLANVTDAFDAFQQPKGEANGLKSGLDYWVQARALGNIHSADLVEMGLAIHSIPGMSAEPERVFSRYGLNIHSSL